MVLVEDVDGATAGKNAGLSPLRRKSCGGRKYSSTFVANCMSRLRISEGEDLIHFVVECLTY